MAEGKCLQNPDVESSLKVRPVSPLEISPDAPEGMYRYESEPNNTKIYFPMFDFTIDLDVLINGDSDENLSDFIIMISEEDSDSSVEAITIRDKKKTVKKGGKIDKKKSVKESTKEAKSTDSDSSVEIVAIKERKKEDKENGRQAKTTSEKFKYELPIQEPDHLYGSYHCSDCNIILNSKRMYMSHINGKKHFKNIKAKDAANAVMKCVPRCNEEIGRYPLPPTGVQRMVMKEKAIIQDIVDDLPTPCPGLYKVIEIQGIADTTYYCKLCDSPCSGNSIIPHLKGIKHQMSCLKYFRPKLAEIYSSEPKYKLGKEISCALRNVEKKEGTGSIIVEREFIDGGDPHSKRPRADINWPSTSSAQSSASSYDGRDVLDVTKSGFYCRICEAPMNCEEMWFSHLRGKRHAANLKKIPGTMPSKLKSIPMPNAQSVLEKKLKHFSPVVGLDHIREVQNKETGSETYQCLLCGACHTSYDIEEHVLSQKHKKKYLEYMDHEDLGYLKSLNFRHQNIDAIIEDICRRAEEEFGRGRPQVFLSRDCLL